MLRTPTIVLVLLTSLCSLAQSAEPLEVLRSAIDEGISILMESQSGGSESELQRERLWRIVHETCDFEEFARQVLGRHWRKFTPQQRDDFMHLFTRLLRTVYLRKAQKAYQKERVIYISQRLVAESRAQVEIKVIWRDMGIPVEIWMVNKNGSWRAYDAVVLGVSVAQNYRAQCHAILLRESPSQLIERLGNKLNELGTPLERFTGYTAP